MYLCVYSIYHPQSAQATEDNANRPFAFRWLLPCRCFLAVLFLFHLNGYDHFFFFFLAKKPQLEYTFHKITRPEIVPITSKRRQFIWSRQKKKKRFWNMYQNSLWPCKTSPALRSDVIHARSNICFQAYMMSWGWLIRIGWKRAGCTGKGVESLCRLKTLSRDKMLMPSGQPMSTLGTSS